MPEWTISEDYLDPLCDLLSGFYVETDFDDVPRWGFSERSRAFVMYAFKLEPFVVDDAPQVKAWLYARDKADLADRIAAMVEACWEAIFTAAHVDAGEVIANSEHPCRQAIDTVGEHRTVLECLAAELRAAEHEAQADEAVDEYFGPIGLAEAVKLLSRGRRTIQLWASDDEDGRVKTREWGEYFVHRDLITEG